jgi:hypothetical protein
MTTHSKTTRMNRLPANPAVPTHTSDPERNPDGPWNRRPPPHDSRGTGAGAAHHPTRESPRSLRRRSAADRATRPPMNDQVGHHAVDAVQVARNCSPSRGTYIPTVTLRSAAASPGYRQIRSDPRSGPIWIHADRSTTFESPASERIRIDETDRLRTTLTEKGSSPPRTHTALLAYGWPARPG